MSEAEQLLLKALLWQLDQHPCCVGEESTALVLKEYGIKYSCRDGFDFESSTVPPYCRPPK